jgi:DNA-binding transcriptional LysR family regulator
MSELDRICHRIKLRHLRIFEAISRSGSMARAARHLSISQSVMSKVVYELEAILDARLLDRTPTGVELTPYGIAFLKHVHAILDDVKVAVGEVKSLSDPQFGNLVVGTSEPQSGITLKTIKMLMRKWEAAQFTVVVGAGMSIFAKTLRDRQIELAVSTIPKPLDDDLQSAVLYTNRMYVVASAKSRWARMRRVDLGSLVDERWCAPVSQYPVSDRFRAAFEKSGLPVPRVTLSCSDNHLCHTLIADDELIGITSNGYANFYVDRRLKVLPVEFPAPDVQVGVMFLKNRTITALGQRFIDCAVVVAQALR